MSLARLAAAAAGISATTCTARPTMLTREADRATKPIFARPTLAREPASSRRDQSSCAAAVAALAGSGSRTLTTYATENMAVAVTEVAESRPSLDHPSYQMNTTHPSPTGMLSVKNRAADVLVDRCGCVRSELERTVSGRSHDVSTLQCGAPFGDTIQIARRSSGRADEELSARLMLQPARRPLQAGRQMSSGLHAGLPLSPEANSVQNGFAPPQHAEPVQAAATPVALGMSPIGLALRAHVTPTGTAELEREHVRGPPPIPALSLTPPKIRPPSLCFHPDPRRCPGPKQLEHAARTRPAHRRAAGARGGAWRGAGAAGAGAGPPGGGGLGKKKKKSKKNGRI